MAGKETGKKVDVGNFTFLHRVVLIIIAVAIGLLTGSLLLGLGVSHCLILLFLIKGIKDKLSLSEAVFWSILWILHLGAVLVVLTE